MVSRFHLMAWKENSQAEIVAIADPNLENARLRAGEAGLSEDCLFAGLAELLAAVPDLDFLDITTPPDTHLELVRLAAAHGLHVNCQKPFAPSLKEARAMIAACREAGVLLNVFENWRWRAWHRRLRALMDEGVVGRPVYARILAHASAWTPTAGVVSPRFLTWPRVLLYDMGVHYMDILRFLLGGPTHVTARLNRLSPKLIGEDRALVLLDFPAELHAILDLSWSSYARWGHPTRDGHLVEDLCIEGDCGSLQLIPHPERGDLIRVTTAAGVHEEPAHTGAPFEGYIASYVAAQRHFVECLLAGRPTETEASDNFHSLALDLAAYHAAETRRTLAVAEYLEIDR
jgi:predicted dehydrogenase